LSLFITAVLLISGALLLGVNYLLVRGTLPVPPSGTPVPTGGITAPTGGTNAPTTGETGRDVEVVPDNPSEARSQVREVTVAEYRSDVLNTLFLQSGITLLGSVLGALLLGRLVAARMLRPVHQVVATARRLSADNLDQRIRLRGPRDELTELADTFDDMLDRLAKSFESRRRFVANASHELRTPLTTQRTLVEVAMARPGDQKSTRDLCERLLLVNARSEALIEGLLLLAGSDQGLEHPEDVRLDEVVARAVEERQSTLELAGIRLHLTSTPRVVRSEPVLLGQLVANLVDNAVKYNNGGAIWIRVGQEPAVEVANTGPPVPADRVASLFEPFVRLSRARVGTDRGVGLGLSIVRSIAAAHGGAVRATPREGGGLVVAVSLP
jgi:signal transduction histidine kinase